jgi:7-cyano-7-deazaguanine synthase
MRSVVLLSGGMDSAIALHWALREHGRGEVAALAIDYGQRHRIELVRASVIAARAGVPVVRVEALLPWTGTSLTRGGALDHDRVVVPGRNTILLTLAAARALSYGADRVVIGCCQDDAERFPDCRPQYLRVAERALSLGLGVPFAIDAPLVHRSKAAAIALMRELGEACEQAVARSWSCYDPQDAGARSPTPCGRCLACEHRARGFAEAGVRDLGVP